MEKNTNGRYEIRLGRFRDECAEREFRAYELDDGYRNIVVVLPVLGLIFLLFSVPDLMTLGWTAGSGALIAVRGAFFAIALVAPNFLGTSVPVDRRELVLVAVTVAGVAAFSLALFVYRNGNYYLQGMSVLLMINAAYLIPNRFSVSVAVALVLVSVGVLYIQIGENDIPSGVKMAFMVDCVLMALVSSIVWLRTCRSKRREYVESMELERISKTDQLTGLGNRRDLAGRLAEAHARSSRYGETYALILVDLDRFKTLNDNFGHEAGDEALRETARRLTGALRSEDALCRWGGEEFIVLLSYATVEAALESARRLKTALSATPMPLVGTLTASFGVTLLRPGEPTQDAVARADVALYRAKDAGRNRVEFEP